VRRDDEKIGDATLKHFTANCAGVDGGYSEEMVISFARQSGTACEHIVLHIPKSVALNIGRLFSPDGGWKTRAEIRAEQTAAGVPEDLLTEPDWPRDETGQPVPISEDSCGGHAVAER
jgi:hypothetical protein